MKIAHLSDNHLGYSQYNLVERKKDFVKAFEQAVDRIIEEDAEIVLHTGDLFESSQPDMSSLSIVIKAFKKLKENGIPVVAILGNHDRVLRKGKLPPHKILEELGLLTLITGGTGVGSRVVKDLFIAGIDFMPKPYIEHLLQERVFEKLSEKASAYSSSLFMFHQALDIYLPYENAFELSFSDLPTGFSYYGGGHIHIFAKEKIGEGFFSYAGATEYRSVKEAALRNRGLNIFDISEKTLKRVKLDNLREFYQFDIREGEEAKLEYIYEEIAESSIPPVVTLRYIYEKKPFYPNEEIFKRLKDICLIVRVLQREVLEEENRCFSSETVSVEKVVGDYFSKHKKIVGNLAVELATSSSEQTEEILVNFLKEKMSLELDF